MIENFHKIYNNANLYKASIQVRSTYQQNIPKSLT